METLADLNFTLYPGSFYFLTGPSGAGKTSLLKLLYLSQRPSRGVIRLFGEDAVTMPRERLPGSMPAWRPCGAGTPPPWRRTATRPPTCCKASSAACRE